MGYGREDLHCRVKAAWPSKAAAKTIISKMNKKTPAKDGLKFSAYKCVYCGSWHVGKQSKLPVGMVVVGHEWKNGDLPVRVATKNNHRG